MPLSLIPPQVKPPRNGRTVGTADLYLANNAVFNVLDFGASPTATPSVNATAIQAAATAAGVDGLLTFPPGYSLATDGNLVIYGPVMGKGAELRWSGVGDAITTAPPYAGPLGVGSPALIQNQALHFPRLVNTRKPAALVTPGWAMAGVAGSVGIRIRHTHNCEIKLPFVGGFESNVVFYGEHDGCDYNDVYIGYLYNGKRNLVIDATGDGWCNENNFAMGRLSHDPNEGVSIAGTRQVLILGGTTGIDILNNHRFRLSLEGDVAEYIVETHGADCLWDWCRWETNLNTPKFLSNGANAISNAIYGGFGAHRIQCSVANGAQQPRTETRDSLAIGGASNTAAVLKLVNSDSSASPILWAYKAGQDLLAANAQTNWVWQLTALGLQGKADTDATAIKRLFLDPATGFGTFGKVLSPLIDSGGGQAAAIDGGPAITLMTGFNCGIVIVADTNTGKSAVIWIGSTSAILAGAAASFSLVQGTASRYNVYTAGGNLMFENKSGFGTAAVPALVLRLF